MSEGIMGEQTIHASMARGVAPLTLPVKKAPAPAHLKPGRLVAIAVRAIYQQPIAVIAAPPTTIAASRKEARPTNVSADRGVGLQGQVAAVPALTGVQAVTATVVTPIVLLPI